ncbi:hypothetical protein VHUM_00962 [Vanrija humicola]|uniref:BZIP domain-containing protein n=1 Tax=Vanrija humicola TaxID=5417 RepID=A0A7D8ZGN1_VANHU|nr:hypothetical protein VHUM_00962 [Vanrija humicola]
MFDLEPNPFEQSFSRGSASTERTTPPRGGDATSVKHNALPPLSSLTSPAAADPSQFPWLAGHSLRAGPLSPAMLAGPAQGSQAAAAAGETNTTNNNSNTFESGTFRTGFTPGTGSGFTPGYNALLNSNFGALPMPSPNTAAFLNSITNVNETAEGAAATGNGAPVGQFNERQPPSAIPPHLQSQQGGPHGLSHLNPAHGGQETIPPNALNALTTAATELNRPAGGIAPPFYQPVHPAAVAPGMSHPDFAQQNANAASQAANGLFLLSQAHQELSKREEEAKSGSTPKRSAEPKAAGQKRKESGTGKAGAAKKGKKAKDEASESSDGDGADDKKGNRNETEEDKRRNFLERNRQAALKCRQRKKAWLGELQNKVETLSMENERLQQTVHTLDEEIARLSSILMQHRDCGLGIPMQQPAYGRPLR